jgi:hypothetical protein
MSRRTPRVFQDPTRRVEVCVHQHASPPGRKRRQVRRRGFSVARVWRSGLAVLRRPGRRWLVLIAGRRGGWSRRWRGGALASVRDRGRGSWCRRRGGPCEATRAPGRTGRVGRSGLPVRGCGATRAVPPLTARGGENASTLGRNRCWRRRSAGSVGSHDVSPVRRRCDAGATPVGDVVGVWVATQQDGSTGRA